MYLIMVEYSLIPIPVNPTRLSQYVITMSLVVTWQWHGCDNLVVGVGLS